MEMKVFTGNGTTNETALPLHLSTRATREVVSDNLHPLNSAIGFNNCSLSATVWMSKKYMPFSPYLNNYCILPWLWLAFHSSYECDHSEHLLTLTYLPTTQRTNLFFSNITQPLASFNLLHVILSTLLKPDSDTQDYKTAYTEQVKVEAKNAKFSLSLAFHCH